MTDIIASLGAQDYIALAAIALAVLAAARFLKKRGGKGCGCGSCSGCAFAEECRNKKDGKKDGKKN